MTKTYVDVHMFFTCFVSFSTNYEGLFKICNTDSYLYCFYIKKENIFLIRMNILLSFINKHFFFLWISHFDSCCLPYLNKQKDLKTMSGKKKQLQRATDNKQWYSEKRSPLFHYFHILHNSSSAFSCHYQGQRKPKKCQCTHTPGLIPVVCHRQRFRETKVAFCSFYQRIRRFRHYISTS